MTRLSVLANLIALDTKLHSTCSILTLSARSSPKAATLPLPSSGSTTAPRPTLGPVRRRSWCTPWRTARWACCKPAARRPDSPSNLRLESAASWIGQGRSGYRLRSASGREWRHSAIRARCIFFAYEIHLETQIQANQTHFNQSFKDVRA